MSRNDPFSPPSPTTANPRTSELPANETDRPPSVVPSLERWDSTNTPVAEATRWLALGLVLVFVAYIVVNLAKLDRPYARVILALDIAAVLMLAAGFFALRRIGQSTRWAEPIATALTAVAVLNTSITGYLRASALEFVYTAFVLIAIGAIVVSVRYLALAAGFTLVVSTALASLALSREGLVEYAMTLVLGIAMMLSIYLARRTNQQRLADLREVDRGLALSLSEALNRSELRLLEQRRAEQERQRLEDQLRQSQKLEAIGTLAGGVAHDMNNVLGAITSISSLALERIEPTSPLRQDVEDVLSAARRGSALTRNLLGFARQGSRRRERFRLESTVDSIRRLVGRTVSKQVELKTQIETDLDDAIGDPGQISHALMNLCINAVDAMHGRGTLTISLLSQMVDGKLAHTHNIEPGRYVWLTVADTGEGIPPEIIGRVFEPFFSTKSAAERSGLGLSMVYGTIRDHGGAIWIDSHLGAGTRVSMLIPSELAKPDTLAPPPPQPVRPVGARTHILIVDDEPLLRSAARRIVRGLGFEVLLACHGAEGLAVFRRYQENVALVLLDLAMPVMGGRECFFGLRKLDPEIPILITSGFASGYEVEELMAQGAIANLPKPYDQKQLTHAINRSLSLVPTSSGISGSLPVAFPLSESSLKISS